MSTDTTLPEILALLLGMEARLVGMRAMMVFLTADRFARDECPNDMLRMTSEAMARAVSSGPPAAADVVLAEMAEFVADVRQIMSRASSG